MINWIFIATIIMAALMLTGCNTTYDYAMVV